MQGLRFDGQRALILAPHADDETLGCGGVIQKYIQQKSPVRVLIATFVLGGDKRYKKDAGIYQNYQGETRIKELQMSMSLLGVTDFHILYKDQSPHIRYQSKLDTLPIVEIVENLEKHVEDFKPTVIYIPSKTKHQDHETLHRAALAAVRPYYWQGSVFVYETDGEITFEPNLFVPLSEEEMKRKIRALEAYQTQLGPGQHPVSSEAMYSKSSFRGYQIYTKYAEAFQIWRLHG